MRPADHADHAGRAGRAGRAGDAGDAGDADRPPHEPGVSRRWWQGRLFQVTLSLLVVVLIFGFLFPKLANYGEVWKTVRDMTWLEVATLALVALWNLASYWPLLVAVQPGLRVREAAVANLASTAIANTLPGGGALGVGVTVGMQRTWGIPVGEIALAGVVSGIWNNFVKLGLPIVALGLLTATGHTGAGLATAAVVGLVVLAGAITLFAMLLRTAALAARVGALTGRAASAVVRPLHRGPFRDWDERAVRFRADTIGLLKGRSWWITTATVVSHLSLYVVLLVALRNVGVSNDEIGWVRVLAAFAFVRLLSAVPLTPGGLGVVELSLTAALGSGLPDTTKNQIAAAVLVYRALTWFAPIPLGVVSWLFWRSNRSWRRTAEERRAWLASAPAISVAGRA